MKKVIDFLAKYWLWACLALVVIFGCVLRFYKLGQIPSSLYWDETAMLVDAKLISQTGRDMHGNFWLQAMFPSYGDYKLPVYIWLASLSVKFFGATDWALRLPSALIGTVQIITISIFVQILFFGRKITDKSKILFLTTAAIAAVSPWSILFSRTGFEGFAGQFLLQLSILFQICFFKLENKFWKTFFLVISILIGALSVYTYYSVRFVWPIIFMAGCITFSFSNHSRKKIFQFFRMVVVSACSLILWSLLLTPLNNSPYFQASQQFRLSTDSLLSRDFATESNKLRQLAGNDFESRFFYHRYLLMSRELGKNVSSHLDLNFLFLLGDNNLRHGTGQGGLFQWWMIIGFIVGLISLPIRKRKEFAFLLIWWLAALLPASVPLTVPHALRSLNALTPLVVIIGYGFFQIFQYIYKSFSIKMSNLISLQVVMILVLSVPFVHDYFVHYSSRSAIFWQDGYRQLVTFVEKNKNDYDDVWIKIGDDRLYLWFMAYGNYSAKDIQNWRSKNYQFQNIGNIHFEQLNSEEMSNLHGKFLIVTLPGELKNQPKNMFTITGSAGEDRFVVGEYAKL